MVLGGRRTRGCDRSCSPVTTPTPPFSGDCWIDTAAQDYRRLPALKFSQLFRKPRFATSLQRVTAVLNHAEELPPVLLDLGSGPAPQFSNADVRSAAPSYEPPPLIPLPGREPSLPPVIPHSTHEPPPLKALAPPAIVPQRMPSPRRTPSPPPASVLMDVDKTPDGDVTEADTDSNSPVHPKSRVHPKIAIPSSGSSPAPAAKRRKVQKAVPVVVSEEDDSEDAKLKPASKGKTKALVQDSDSDGSLPAGRGRGRGAAVTRVKQPLKRGGRRL